LAFPCRSQGWRLSRQPEPRQRVTPPSASSRHTKVSSAHLAARCIKTSASALARQREQMFSQFVVPPQSVAASRFVMHAACGEGVHPHPNFRLPGAHCGLTPRSTGPTTAGGARLARSGFATVARQPYAACLRGPVTSNVRPHEEIHPSDSANTGSHNGLGAHNKYCPFCHGHRRTS
jgi:hypothetical protein